MKRTLCVAVLAISCIVLSGAWSTVSAQPQVWIEWSTNGAGPAGPSVDPDVFAEVGDQLTATFWIENAVGIMGYTVEVEYDVNDLALVSSAEFLPPGFEGNFTPGTDSLGLCTGLMYDAYRVLASTPVMGPIKMGEAVFEVIAVNNDLAADIFTGPCTPDSIFQSLGLGLPADQTTLTSFQTGQVKSVAAPMQTFAIYGKSDGIGWSWRIDVNGSPVASDTGLSVIATLGEAAFRKKFVDSIDANAGGIGCDATGVGFRRFKVTCLNKPFEFFVLDAAATPGSACKVTGTLVAAGAAGAGCQFNPTIVQVPPGAPALTPWSVVFLVGLLIATTLAFVLLRQRNATRGV